MADGSKPTDDDSKTKEKADIDYDNLGRGTEADRILSARKDDDTKNNFARFEIKFDRMLRLEQA